MSLAKDASNATDYGTLTGAIGTRLLAALAAATLVAIAVGLWLQYQDWQSGIAELAKSVKQQERQTDLLLLREAPTFVDVQVRRTIEVRQFPDQADLHPNLKPRLAWAYEVSLRNEGGVARSVTIHLNGFAEFWPPTDGPSRLAATVGPFDLLPGKTAPTMHFFGGVISESDVRANLLHQLGDVSGTLDQLLPESMWPAIKVPERLANPTLDLAVRYTDFRNEIHHQNFRHPIEDLPAFPRDVSLGVFQLRLVEESLSPIARYERNQAGPPMFYRSKVTISPMLVGQGTKAKAYDHWQIKLQNDGGIAQELTISVAGGLTAPASERHAKLVAYPLSHHLAAGEGTITDFYVPWDNTPELRDEFPRRLQHLLRDPENEALKAGLLARGGAPTERIRLEFVDHQNTRRALQYVLDRRSMGYPFFEKSRDFDLLLVKSEEVVIEPLDHAKWFGNRDKPIT